MTREKIEYLERIYNTFSLIETKGNNTIIMGQALNALKEFIQSIPILEDTEE